MNNLISKHIQIRLDELEISVKQIEELARMDENMPSFSSFIQNELDKQFVHLRIEGGYVIYSAEVAEGSIIVHGQPFKTGASIASQLTKSEHIAVFACTAGQEVSDRVDELNASGLFLEAYLIDILGSVIVEKAMDKIQRILEDEQDVKGLNITNRYSPGYNSWSVAEQAALFKLLPEKFCGIALSDSCLMTPIKSVSGIIGIGADVKYQKHACSSCNSTRCLYRHSKNHC